MHGLEKGINQLAEQETNQKVRKNAIDSLNGIIEDLNAGIGVWNDLLSKGIPKSETGGYGGWAGFTVETKLFELELDARDKAKQASSGQSSLDVPLVALAYGKLSEGQSGEDAARGAVNAMEDRIKAIKSLITTIQNTKPKKPAAAKGSAKKAVKAKASAAKKKPAKKKTTKKTAVKKKAAAKKAAKKKPTKKKATKKKAVKKKAPTKKTTKKKAAKKKVVNKKPTNKKAAKKKAPTKKATKKKTVKKKKTKRR